MSKKFGSLASKLLEDIDEYYGNEKAEMSFLGSRGRRFRRSAANCDDELSKIDRETISHIIKTRKISDEDLRKFLH